METINTPQEPTNYTLNKPSNSKTWIYGTIAILVVAGLVFAFTQGDRKAPGDYTFEEIMNLPAEEQQGAFEAQVKDLEVQLANLQQGTEEGSEHAYQSAKHRISIKLAESQNQLGRYNDALKSLDNIPESQQNNPDVLRAFGLAYKGMGQKEQANEKFRQAIEEDKTNAEVWLTYIESSSELPNDQLDGLYREAIAATKSHVDVMISYARFNERIGNKDLAVAAWETAINVDSANEAEYRAEIARLRQ